MQYKNHPHVQIAMNYYLFFITHIALAPIAFIPIDYVQFIFHVLLLCICIGVYIQDEAESYKGNVVDSTVFKCGVSVACVLWTSATFKMKLFILFDILKLVQVALIEFKKIPYKIDYYLVIYTIMLIPFQYDSNIPVQVCLFSLACILCRNTTWVFHESVTIGFPKHFWLLSCGYSSIYLIVAVIYLSKLAYDQLQEWMVYWKSRPQPELEPQPIIIPKMVAVVETVKPGYKSNPDVGTFDI